MTGHSLINDNDRVDGNIAEQLDESVVEADDDESTSFALCILCTYQYHIDLVVSGHFVPMRSRPIPFRTQGHKLPYHFVPKSYHFVPKVIPFRTHILLYCFNVNLNC